MEMNRVRDFGSSGMRKRSGFTLIELLGVIVIMMILSGIVLGIAGYAGRKADESRAQAELQQLRNLLEEYRLDRGSYPQTYLRNRGAWRDIFGGEEDDENALWRRYVESVTYRDPWGRAYQYETHGRFSYELYSHGPSGAGETYDQIR